MLRVLKYYGNASQWQRSQRSARRGNKSSYKPDARAWCWFMMRGAFVFLLLSSASAYAQCTSSSGVNTTSQYIQNASITCSGQVTVTPVNGALSGYGWGAPLTAPKISAQTSQVLRWTNATSSTALVTNIDSGAVMGGTGLTRPMLFSRTGYYTQNGSGTVVVAPWITPTARPTISIINNGTVQYKGTTTSAFDWGAAAGIDADDSPVDQYLINSGTLSSTSGWSTIIRDFATGGTFGLDARDAASYAYSYNNIIGITNSGTIIQTGAVNPLQVGAMASHSSALQMIVISAKEVSVINSGTISGTANGIDVLTTGLVSNPHIDNSGLIHGGVNAVNMTPVPGNIVPGIKGIPINPYLKTLTNHASGTIAGGSVGVNIASGSTVEAISNAGTISGQNYSIRNEGSLSSITNSGVLNGNVLLGGARLDILGNAASILGTTTGNGTSVINIGTALQAGAFSSEHSAEVGRINIFATSRLALAAGVNWKALAGETDAIANSGEIELANASSLTGNAYNSGILSLSAGNTVAANIVGNLINSGALRIGSPNPRAGNTLTVNGDYTGQGGVIFINTVMGDDSSATDRFVVTGSTSGTTPVRVRNVGGAGALTGEGIEIITVDGLSDGVFSLIGDEIYQNRSVVVAGVYAYGLYKGNASGTDISNWYLRSQTVTTKPEKPVPLLTPAAQIYEVYPAALLALNSVSTLQQRTGNRFWSASSPTQNTEGSAQDMAAAIETTGVWGRIEGAYSNIHSRISTSGADFSQTYGKFQIGITGTLAEHDDNRLIGGVFGQYGHANTIIDSRNPFGWGNGRIAIDGYSLGGTLTWYEQGGFYVDGLAQASWYESDLSGSGSRVYTSANHGLGYALSLESGQRIMIDRQWSVTPQAQLVYSSVRFDSFTDIYGAAARLDDADSLQGRVGLTLDYGSTWKDASGQVSRTHIYGIGNLYYEFLNGTKVSVDTLGLANGNDRLWSGLGTGASYNWRGDRYSLYGEGLAASSFDNFGNSYSFSGRIGFRMKF